MDGKLCRIFFVTKPAETFENLMAEKEIVG
jgi:hypothetical protein